MNKLQTKLDKIMLSILPFKGFRQNDVVEDMDGEQLIVLQNEKYGGKIDYGRFLCSGDNAVIILEDDELKFISRDWTLNDLLMCLNHKHLIIKEIVCMTYKDISIQYPAMINNKEINVMIDYDLTKNLLDQDNLKEIIGVLK